MNQTNKLKIHKEKRKEFNKHIGFFRIIIYLYGIQFV
jgi:hypothetical protein